MRRKNAGKTAAGLCLLLAAQISALAMPVEGQAAPQTVVIWTEPDAEAQEKADRALRADPALYAQYFGEKPSAQFGQTFSVTRAVEADGTPVLRLTIWPSASANQHAMHITLSVRGAEVRPSLGLSRKLLPGPACVLDYAFGEGKPEAGRSARLRDAGGSVRTDLVFAGEDAQTEAAAFLQGLATAPACALRLVADDMRLEASYALSEARPLVEEALALAEACGKERAQGEQ
ncbi:MAG: hypothetical protein Q4F72_07700 [Desulfovibrionaceae bacterium]|nr:hypothetical protein [Desulfovibrionaceae bacterium]